MFTARNLRATSSSRQNGSRRSLRVKVASPQKQTRIGSSASEPFAYTGHYRVEGDRLTTKVDVAWNEAWRGTDQVRFFQVQGDKLFIESAALASVNYPEMGQVRGILEWERSK